MTTIVVIGPPGAGKGTRIAEAKKAIPNIISISTGELLREKGVDTSSGELISDEVVLGILKEKLNSVKADIIILDGVPRNLIQAITMKEYGIKIDRIIHLPVSEDEAVRRAADRLVCSNPSCQAGFTLSNFKPPKRVGICDKCGSPLTKRPDDNEETVRQRMSIYYQKTEPLLQFYKSEDVEVITIEEGNLNRFIEAIDD